MNTDYFDYMPQKFYLLSVKNRRLFSYESADRSIEMAVEEAFEKLPRLEGGNVYAVFKYEPVMLKVMMELSEMLKKQYPNIQQLPAFMRKLEVGDIFIRHQAGAPLPDLKRTIIKVLALTKGRNPQHEDNNFVLNWCKLYLIYDTCSFGFLSDKIYAGEDDPDKRVCRFCRKTGKDRFRDESHAIMEALGNRLLICNEECDECNHDFESTVEKHLFKFLEINRTLYNVSGKGSKNHHLEGLNFHIHPDPATLQPVVYLMQDKIVNDTYKGSPTGKIHLYNNGEVSFNGIYKALVKIAVDLIPSDRMSHFIKTGQWVHGDFEGENLPVYLYGEHDEFFEQPVVDLFFKKEGSPDFSPYCTVILYIFNSIFIYTLPYCDIDGERFAIDRALKSHFSLFKSKQYLHVPEWEEFDANDRTVGNPIYKIPVIPTGVNYKVEFRPSDDEVFEIKRK